MAKDGRMSLCISESVLNRVRIMANAKLRSTQQQIELLLRDGCGYRGVYPSIVSNGNSYLWIAPTGYYGEVTKLTYHSFLHDCLPLDGDRWDESFGSMEDACNALGVDVCRWTVNGLTVTDVNAFIRLHQLYAID